MLSLKPTKSVFNCSEIQGNSYPYSAKVFLFHWGKNIVLHKKLSFKNFNYKHTTMFRFRYEVLYCENLQNYTRQALGRS